MKAVIFAVCVLLASSVHAYGPIWIPPGGGWTTPNGTMQWGYVVDPLTGQTFKDVDGTPKLFWRPRLELVDSWYVTETPGYWLPSPFPHDLSELVGGAQGCKMYVPGTNIPTYPPVVKWVQPK